MLPVVTVILLSLPDVVTKYSNFVSFPLYLNGKRINTLQVSPAAAEGLRQLWRRVGTFWGWMGRNRIG